MKRAAAVAVAACGLFGLISVRLVEVNPPPWVKLAILGLGLVALAVVVVLERRQPHRVRSELRAYLANPARRGRKAYRIVHKTYSISVESSPGSRRDATTTVDLRLRNVSRRPVVQADFPIAGDTWVRPGQVDVLVTVAGERVGPEVSFEDGYSLVVSVPLPTPGISPGDEVDLQVSWSWPGIGNLGGGGWIVGTSDMQIGAPVAATIEYPLDAPQVADVTAVRSFAGRRWDRPCGALPSVRTANTFRFEFKSHRRRFDAYFIIDMSASPDFKTPGVAPAGPSNG